VEEDQDRGLVLRAIGRRPWVVVAFVVLTAAAGYAVSGLQPTKYAASSSLLFGKPDVTLQLFPNVAPPADPASAADTEVRLVLSRPVAERVARRLPGVTPDQVQRHVTASQEGQSDVVKITATAGNPRRAATLANVYADEFVTFRRRSDSEHIAAARTRLAAETDRLARTGAGVQARRLRRQQDQLATLQALVTGNVERLDEATPPDHAAAPNRRRSLLLGGFAGLLIGLGAAVGLERFDPRVRRSRDVEEALGLPVLATIPRGTASAEAPVAALLARAASMPPDLEPFRALRTKLRYLGALDAPTSILITSAEPREGRSTVAVGLAVAAASAGDRVLLIEADWRRPAPAPAPRQGKRGLSAVLAGARSFDEALVKIPLAGSSRRTRRSRSSEPARELDVLPAGPPPANPGELIESARMRELLMDAERRYQLVVIDTPPMSVVADAFALMGSVTGAIVVTRLHRSTHEAIAVLRDQLSDLSNLVIGLVINGGDRPRRDERAYLRPRSNGSVSRRRPRDAALHARARRDA
jgi:capsular exopolysaccharide synthesis family protein